MSEAITAPTHRGAVAGHHIARVVIGGPWKVRVHGYENVPASGPVILAPNHSGIIDGPLIMCATKRPIHALVKKEMFKGPMGWLLKGVGQILVNRDEPSRASLQTAQAVLADGRVLVVFPEGTRGAGDFAELRTGLAWFALRSGAPVVPVAMKGTDDHSLAGWPRPRSRLEIVYGAPVTVAAGGARTRAALDAATEQLREALIAHRTAVMGSQPSQNEEQA